MKDKDAIDMARRAVEEIKMLRGAMSSAAPRAQAYDLIEKIMGLIPAKSQGYGEDIVWRLEKQIADLEANAAPKVAEQ